MRRSGANIIYIIANSLDKEGYAPPKRIPFGAK